MGKGVIGFTPFLFNPITLLEMDGCLHRSKEPYLRKIEHLLSVAAFRRNALYFGVLTFNFFIFIPIINQETLRL